MLVNKTTKGFVIAACTVVIAAGGWADYKEGSRLSADMQRESDLQAAKQQRLETCMELSSNPDRENRREFGLLAVIWSECVREFGRRWQ